MALSITKIKDYIIEVEGKYPFMINEVVKFKNDAMGIVMKATDKRAFIALFDSSVANPLKVGDSLTPLKKEFAINVKEEYLGNIIGVDGAVFSSHIQEPGVVRSTKTESRPIFRLARPIYSRD